MVTSTPEPGSTRWIQTDECEDVAGSVRHALRTARSVGDDPQGWKWIVLALHSALQGACICHLTTTAVPIGAVTRENAGEWLAYFELSRDDRHSKLPRTRLMALPELLKAVRREHSAGDRRNAVGITISDAELAWLTRLHTTVRNQFVHFEPAGWLIEISGVEGLAVLISRIISDIGSCGWAFRHQPRQWRDAVNDDLERLTSAFRLGG